MHFSHDAFQLFLQTFVSPEGCWTPYTIYCYPGVGTLCYGLPFLADGSECKPADAVDGKTYVNNFSSSYFWKRSTCTVSIRPYLCLETTQRI